MNYNSKAIRKVIESVVENSKVSFRYEQVIEDNLCCGYRKYKNNGFEVKNIGLKSHPLYRVEFFGKAAEEINKAYEVISKENGYETKVVGNSMTIKKVGDNFWK